jgi:hypothetical protein
MFSALFISKHPDTSILGNVGLVLSKYSQGDYAASCITLAYVVAAYKDWHSPKSAHFSAQMWPLWSTVVAG